MTYLVLVVSPQVVSGAPLQREGQVSESPGTRTQPRSARSLVLPPKWNFYCRQR